jgi:Condensation domain
MLEEIWDRSSTKYSPFQIPLLLNLEGPLSVTALESALNQLVGRHTALRTALLPASIASIERQARLQAFAKTGLFFPGLYRQSVVPSAAIAIPVTDLSGFRETQDIEIQRILAEEAQAAFDYSRPPLLRAKLLKLDGEKHLLVLVLHHLAGDPWSLRIIHKELETLYRAELNHETVTLPEPRIPFHKFSRWQQKQLDTPFFDSRAEYWRNQWETFESAQVWFRDLPCSRPSPAKPAKSIGMEQLTFDPECSTEIRAFADRQGISVRVVVLTAFLIWLREQTGKPAVAVSTICRNRTHPGTENTIGWFANLHIVGVDFSTDLTFLELMEKVSNAIAGAEAHQEIPSALLSRKLGRVPQHSDASVTFHFISAIESPEGVVKQGSLAMEPVGTSRFPALRPGAGLALSGIDKQAGIVLTATHSTDRLPPEDVRKMVSVLHEIVIASEANPDWRISRF